jgi:hypothetical protein
MLIFKYSLKESFPDAAGCRVNPSKEQMAYFHVISGVDVTGDGMDPDARRPEAIHALP